MAVSYPRPTFSWTRHGVPINDFQDRVHFDPVEGTLVVRTAEKSDSGDWVCVAINEQGQGRASSKLEYIGECANIPIISLF